MAAASWLQRRFPWAQLEVAVIDKNRTAMVAITGRIFVFIEDLLLVFTVLT
jgi:hypothetical protein